MWEAASISSVFGVKGGRLGLDLGSPRRRPKGEAMRHLSGNPLWGSLAVGGG